MLPYVTRIWDVSLKSNIPLGDEQSKVSLPDLFKTNSATNLRSGVVASCVSYHASDTLCNTGMYFG
jgi:hypothetical protein